MLAALPDIQNKQPDSKEEVWVAMALDRLKMPYIYQFDLFGTGSERVSIKLDFLILRPFPIDLEVQGEHWHTGELGADDVLRKAIIEAEGIPVFYLWATDLPTPEAAYTQVRRIVN